MRELLCLHGFDVAVQIRDPLLHRRFVSIVSEMNREATLLEPEASCKGLADALELVSKILLRIRKADPQGLKARIAGGLWRHGSSPIL
jgi:hypothetical protein